VTPWRCWMTCRGHRPRLLLLAVRRRPLGALKRSAGSKRQMADPPSRSCRLVRPAWRRCVVRSAGQRDGHRDGFRMMEGRDARPEHASVDRCHRSFAGLKFELDGVFGFHGGHRCSLCRQRAQRLAALDALEVAKLVIDPISRIQLLPRTVVLTDNPLCADNPPTRLREEATRNRAFARQEVKCRCQFGMNTTNNRVLPLVRRHGMTTNACNSDVLRGLVVR